MKNLQMETLHELRNETAQWTIKQNVIDFLISENGNDEETVKNIIEGVDTSGLFDLYFEELEVYAKQKFDINIKQEEMSVRDFDKLADTFKDLPTRDERVTANKHRAIEVGEQIAENEGLNHEETEKIVQAVLLQLLFSYSDEEKEKILYSAYDDALVEVHEDLKTKF